MNTNDRVKLAWLAACALCLFFAPSASVASTGGASLPWDTGVTALVDNVSGPIAHYGVIGALAVAGILWAFSEHGTGVKRLSQVVFGGAVAVGAVDLASTLGISGAIA